MPGEADKQIERLVDEIAAHTDDPYIATRIRSIKAYYLAAQEAILTRLSFYMGHVVIYMKAFQDQQMGAYLEDERDEIKNIVLQNLEAETVALDRFSVASQKLIQTTEDVKAINAQLADTAERVAQIEKHSGRIWGMFSVLVVGIILVVVIVAQPKTLQPVAEYTTVPVPERDILCPGETLVFTPTGRLVPLSGALEGARRVTVLRTWTNLDTRRAAVQRDGSPAPEYYYQRNAVPGAQQLPQAYPVPDFVPARYRFDTTLSAEGAADATYRIVITVPPGCGV